LCWLSAEDHLPAYGRWLSRNLPMLATDGHKRIGYAVGQNMFTPDNIDTTTLQRDDRPYAGWFFAEVSITSETGARLDTAALSVGIVGPWSAVEWTQKRWHETFGFQDPKGREHQLDNEPTLNLTIDRQWRYITPVTLGGFAADMTPHIGGALGNVFTYAAIGATFRFGQDLIDDFGGPPRLSPSLPGAAHFKPRDDFGWYLFAGVGGRAVARNIFLDGNSFGSSHNVDKKTLVGDAQAGLALIFPRFRITYTLVYRSKEFHTQDRGDRFGAISLTARF
jgi:lipid A 3-O-deacylase